MQMYNLGGSTGNLNLSKGNQIKFAINNVWYKADYFGYEGAAEYVASHLLSQSNIIDYIPYTLEDIILNETVYHGCKSNNFLKENEVLITADKLFKINYNISISEKNQKLKFEDRIPYFVENVEKITSINNFGAYLTLILEFDEFILNEDRHFQNIAFIYNKGTKTYSNCPIFDNGAGFLSDTQNDYPLIKSLYGLIPTVKSKPFNENFEEQIKICKKFYNPQLQLSKDIHISQEIEDDINNKYGSKIFNRINNIFNKQKSLSPYLSNNISQISFINDDKSNDYDDI